MFGLWTGGKEAAVSQAAYYGLFALQHRGQQAAGIAVTDGETMDYHKGKGLLSDVFAQNTLPKGIGALAHVLYSGGKVRTANAQPFVVQYQYGTIAVASNGRLTNASKLREELAALLSPAGMVTEEELARIPDITVWLGMMNQLYEMRRYALVFNRTFYISGFVPQADYAQVEKLISAIPNVKIKEAEHNREMPVTPPVKLQNGWFSRPYQMYIEMYSLPGYNGIDPTGMVALIYSVLFGLMFADVGQGLVLGLFGYFYMYRKRQLAIGHILTRAAVFSCLFGLLFGSVFSTPKTGRAVFFSSVWGRNLYCSA